VEEGGGRGFLVLMAATRRRIYSRNGEAGKIARAREAPAGNVRPAEETCLGLGRRARRCVGHANEDGAINASARWVHPPIQPDKAAQPVRGPTQTDRFGRFSCPKWVGPLEMPLEHFEHVCLASALFRTCFGRLSCWR
jgi:hypothetical protein